MTQNGQPPKKPTSKGAVVAAVILVTVCGLGFVLPILIIVIRALWGFALG